MKKRNLCLMLLLTMVLCLSVACGAEKETEETVAPDEIESSGITTTQAPQGTESGETESDDVVIGGETEIEVETDEKSDVTAEGETVIEDDSSDLNEESWATEETVTPEETDSDAVDTEDNNKPDDETLPPENGGEVETEDVPVEEPTDEEADTEIKEEGKEEDDDYSDDWGMGWQPI